VSLEDNIGDLLVGVAEFGVLWLSMISLFKKTNIEIVVEQGF
jgi:hypothetical protein